MAGVGKLLKQAQKMQRGIEALQTQLDAHEIDVTSGGGAVKVKINGNSKFLSLELDPELLKEDPSSCPTRFWPRSKMRPSSRRNTTTRKCRK